MSRLRQGGPSAIPDLCWTASSLLIGGRPSYLVSGELHYFRIPRTEWKARLRLLKATGAQVVSTYIPWLIHEPSEGSFAFDRGDGVTDVEAFLCAVREEGLGAIIKPGPYCYSELVNQGLPEWLLRGYPGILARNRYGQVINYAAVSYLHPLFLEKVERWYAVVCALLQRHLVEAGGCVVMLQLDNEVAGIHGWGQALDCSPEGMGLGREEGRYARFLTERHGSLETINRRYGSCYPSLSEVGPSTFPPSGVGRWLAERDYLDFYCATLRDYLQVLAQCVRRHGVTLPLCHNAANEKMSPLLAEASRLPGGGMLVGVDNYYCLGPHHGQNNPTPQYAARTLISLEMLRLMGGPPVVMEIPAGSYSDWPPITPDDLRACYYLHLALGAKGHNYYVFAGGVNPPGCGLTGDSYDYNAPVGADGTVRPSYDVLTELGGFLARNAWLAEARLAADFALVLDADQARARFVPGPAPDAGQAGPADVWEFVREGLVTSALCAGWVPELVGFDQLGEYATVKPLVVPCSGVMSEAHQRALLAYIERGGRVLMTPVLPTRNEFSEPCCLIAEVMGSGPAVSRLQWGTTRAKLDIANVQNVFFNGSLHVPGVMRDAEVLGREALSGDPVCLYRPHGKGGLILLGLRWTHCKHEHAAMMSALLSRLGGSRRVEGSNPQVWCFLREGVEAGLLFLLNLGTAAAETEVKVWQPAQRVWRELGSYRLAPMTVQTISV